MTAGTEWQNYASASALAAADTFLGRRVSVTPPSAGAVEQVLASQVAQFVTGKALVSANNYCAGDGGEGGTGTDDTTGMQAAINAALAAASTPALTSGTAAQLSATQDVMLYCNVTTASTFALSIGPTSTPATAVVGSHTAAIGLIAVRVPKSWYVKATFTPADVTFTQVTC